MTENHTDKSCKQQLVCRLCFALHPTGMHDYMKKKTNEDCDNAQPRKLGADTVNCASVNGKLDQYVHCICLGWS